MSSKKRRVPKYCLHKSRNLAKVYLDGKTHYLGTYGSPESKALYRKLITEWFDKLSEQEQQANADVRICELISVYIQFCSTYYVKAGKITREYGCIRDALKLVRIDYDLERVDRFGPKALRTVRDLMIERGWSRKYCNKQVGRIVRMFKWGVSEELVLPATWQALMAIQGLKRGRTKAPDYAPVQPVDDATVEATLPHLSTTVADMVRLHRLTGCRPGEICALRPMDLNRDGDVWRYEPSEHKTEHQGRTRTVWLGPQAQALLAKYLLRPAESYCFSPQDEVGVRTNTGTKYTKDSYGRAVRRAAKAAGVELWSPNRLRHSAATEIRRDYGLEAAQIVLGHASADVTQIYAERDQELAAMVARKRG